MHNYFRYRLISARFLILAYFIERCTTTLTLYAILTALRKSNSPSVTVKKHRNIKRFKKFASTEDDGFIFSDHSFFQSCYIDTEIFPGNLIQLLLDLGKVSVQIQRPDFDPVSAHVVFILRIDLLISSGIQQHA